MKHVFFAVVSFVTSVTLCGQQPEELSGNEALRGQCRAHFFYTAALAEDDDQGRMTLLTKALELDPKLERAFYNRGSIYFRKDDLQRAKSDFQKAIQLNDDYIHAHYNLACVLSIESRFDEALVSLEKALAKGYKKLDKIPDDPDLKGLKNNAAFPKLIAKYRANAAPKNATEVQEIQTSAPEERAALLSDAIHEPGPHAMELALWAMHEPDFQLRVLGVQLLCKLNRAESKQLLTRALYDANGYVNKAAANALITYGKEADSLMVWVLEDKDAPAVLYAVQVLARIKSSNAAIRIRPLLRSEDHRIRIIAAESLAALDAASAVPDIEAALKKLPKDERLHAMYQAALGRAIEHLKEVKATNDK